MNCCAAAALHLLMSPSSCAGVPRLDAAVVRTVLAQGGVTAAARPILVHTDTDVATFVLVRVTFLALLPGDLAMAGPHYQEEHGIDDSH